MTRKVIQFWHEFRTWLIVALITGLIWLYAEGNTLRSDQIEARIQFVAPPSANLFIVQPATAEPVTITYRCRADTQQDLIELIRNHPLQIEVSDLPGNEDPHQTIPLRDRLAAYAPLVKLGVTVENVSPATFAIDVYDRVERMLPIRVANDPNLFTRGPTPAPETMAIELPRELVADLEDPHLEVTLDPQVLAGLPDNIAQTLPGRVTLSPALLQRIPPALHEQARPRPGTVDVTFTLADRVAAWRTGLRLQVMMPLEYTGRYVVEAEAPDRFMDLDFSGPPSVIERLERGTDRVRLYVELTGDDLERQTPVEKMPILDRPPNVSATPPRTIVLRIRRVETPLPVDDGDGDGEAVAPVAPAEPVATPPE